MASDSSIHMGYYVDRVNVSSTTAIPERTQSGVSAEVPNQKTGETRNYDEAIISPNKLSDAVDKVNQYAELQKIGLELRIEDEIKRVVVSVVDKETKELIRQIPSEHAIKLAKSIEEVMQEFFAGNGEQAISLLNEEV